MKFKIGDIIKGKAGNGYCITNSNMYKAEVTKILADGDMEIKVLSHKKSSEEGQEHVVTNSDEEFELISHKKITKEELFDFPIGTRITTDAKEDNVFTKTQSDEFENDEYDIINDYDVEDDLTLNDEDYGKRIVKIEVPATYDVVYDFSQQVREMTLAEISEELGYEVKIIKEEK